MELEIINWSDLDPATQASLLARPGAGESSAQTDAVAEIIQQVRTEGDAALRRYTKEFDRAELDELRVSAEEADSAEAALAAETLAAIDVAIGNVRAFHEAQLPVPLAVETSPGILCERISHPIEAVGLYVPAGSAPLPSAAVMSTQSRGGYHLQGRRRAGNCRDGIRHGVDPEGPQDIWSG